MEIFIGRQPIFSRQRKVVGYELLHRNSHKNAWDAIDGDKATSAVMQHSFITFGLNKLTNHKKAFINFTYNLLMSDSVFSLPPDAAVIEILEDIPLNSLVVQRCRELKKMGYTIAVDDVIDDYLPEDILPHIDIVKIDFQQTNIVKQLYLANKYKQFSLTLLAEKVETKEDFERAFKFGYDYFQGYYFSKPKILSGVEMESFPGQYVNIYMELNKEECSIEKIAGLIELDVSLSYKLLRLVNTIGFSRKTKVQSIKQAILLIGIKELRNWIMLFMMTSSIKSEESKEIFHMCLTRAKTAEKIAKEISREPSEFYLFGLFSSIDAILGKPIYVLVKELPLSPYIKRGLMGQEKELAMLLNLFSELENGTENPAGIGFDSAGMTNDKLYELYLQAIEWTNEMSARLL